MSAAGLYHLVVEQGAAFVRTFLYTDDDDVAVNLTGYTARAQLREAYGDAEAVSDWTAYLTIDALAGTITLQVPATVTAAITASRGVWDLELVPPTGADDAIRLLNGKWTLSKEATK